MEDWAPIGAGLAIGAGALGPGTWHWDAGRQGDGKLWAGTLRLPTRFART